MSMDEENMVLCIKASSSEALDFEKKHKAKSLLIVQNTESPLDFEQQTEITLEMLQSQNPEALKILENSVAIASQQKHKKKKKHGVLDKKFQLHVKMSDKTSMTDRPKKIDEQEMTFISTENKSTSDRTLTPLKRLKRLKRPSNSVERIVILEKRLKSSHSPVRPSSTEVEEVVTNLEINDVDSTTPKPPVIVSRTASRVSARVSRMSRTVRQLICCGVAMHAPSEEKLPGRDIYGI